MSYVHTGRHRAEDRPVRELTGPTDLEVMVAAAVAEMRGWGDVYPEGMHDLAAGRPHRGRKSYIRTEMLRHAAELRTPRIDAGRVAS